MGKAEEEDKRNERKKSVNPKIESAATLMAPVILIIVAVVVVVVVEKNYFNTQREIGSRMSRTSFSFFQFKKQNKNNFFFPVKNSNVTGEK